jgi:2-C-methyl-D-erythritol 4-phosphate cytidylyltransferase
MAHRRAVEEGWEEVTDDALLVEKMGIPVKVVEGPEDNIKVTTPQDLELVRFLVERQKEK